MLMTVEKMEKCQSLAIVLDEKKNLTEYKLMENYQSKIYFNLCWCAVIKSIWMLKMNNYILKSRGHSFICASFQQRAAR